MKLGKVSLGVLDSIFIVPEVSGHARERLGADQFTVFIKHFVACIVL